MALPRFYLPQLGEHQSVELTGDDARHALQVLRLSRVRRCAI